MSGRPGAGHEVLVWSTSHGSRNPYPRMLSEELRRRGYRIAEGGVAAALQASPSPRAVLHLHWIGWIFQRSSFWASLRSTLGFMRSLVRLRRKGWRIVWTVHNEQSPRTRHPRLEYLVRLVLLRLLVDRVLIMTESQRQTIARISPRAAARARVVPHPTYEAGYGPPILKDEARQELGVAPELPLLLIFGNLLPYKGVQDALEAFGRLDTERVRLAIVGECQIAQLRSFIERSAARDPRLLVRLGLAPHDEVPRWFSAADWVVLPHRRSLNSGVLFLAVTYRCPVIMAELPSLVDQVRVNGEVPGLTYRPGSPEGLETALRKALVATPERREGWQRAMTALAGQRSIEAVGEKLAQVLTELHGP